MNAVFAQQTEMRVAPKNNVLDVPQMLEDTGISKAFVFDLILKHLYRSGELTGTAVAEKLCIPFPIADTILDETVWRKYSEKHGGKGMGNASDVFGLTGRGRDYVREILDIDTYTGPVPVPLDQYSNMICSKKVRQFNISEELLREAWRDFVLDDEIFLQIGPAMCSGKSCFLYGPPGTGKSTIAKAISKYFDLHGGHVPVPHAVLVGGSVIRVYDPVYHQPVEDAADVSDTWLTKRKHDRRWVMCHRPTVTVGGELTLDMLDLRYNSTTRYYEAPLQMKANGGVFVIDDFGRQMVKPKDLLNRWIVPLEEHIDYLTLHTGKKFSIPFEQMVAFATNLDPRELTDEAFLRRIRYKIFVGELTEQAYKKIFMGECRKKNLECEESELERFIKKYYREKKNLMRACDPRDLTDAALDIISFRHLDQIVTCELLMHLSGGK